MSDKREQIEPNEGDKRYVRRDADGQFTDDQVDIGKSLSADDRRHAESTSDEGDGDQGD